MNVEPNISEWIFQNETKFLKQLYEHGIYSISIRIDMISSGIRLAISPKLFHQLFIFKASTFRWSLNFVAARECSLAAINQQLHNSSNRFRPNIFSKLVFNILLGILLSIFLIHTRNCLWYFSIPWGTWQPFRKLEWNRAWLRVETRLPYFSTLIPAGLKHVITQSGFANDSTKHQPPFISCH